ncbi:hypothetical protein V6N13_006090 [Hibiscus sabdariffa]
MFTDREHQGLIEFSDELGNLSIGGEPSENVVSAQRVGKNDKDLLLTTSKKEESSASLGIKDLLGLVLPSAAHAPPFPQLKLNAAASLDPSTLQQKWCQLPVALSHEYSVSPRGVAALTATQALIWHMQNHYIHYIASGVQSPSFKFFVFAQKMESSSNYFINV